MIKTNNGLVEFAKSKVGSAYMWGAFGQAVTEGFIQQKKRQYPSHYTDEYIAKCRKNTGKRAYDCVGLIKAYYWDGGYNAVTDIGANTMYERASVKGAINTIPEKPGVCVWRSGHIGVYIGNGEVIEARGIDYGVVKTKLNDRDFTNWLECPYIEYEAASEESIVIRLGDTVTVKPGSKTYTGGGIASFVFGRVYRVDELKGERAVLDLKGICTPVNVRDLIKV